MQLAMPNDHENKWLSLIPQGKVEKPNQIFLEKCASKLNMDS